jgi:hypothetical protein
MSFKLHSKWKAEIFKKLPFNITANFKNLKNKDNNMWSS